MPHFRFHLVSLAHLPQSAEYLSCAFTQKNRKLAKMLTSLGHEVWFYGSEGSDVAEYCQSDLLHFVQTHTLSDIRQDYGDGDNRFSCGYDYRNADFRHDFNSARNPSTLKFYQSCVAHIQKVKQPDDFLLLTQGSYHTPIAKEVDLYLTCEPGVGYRGSVKGRFRAFESAYIQNFTYGSEVPYLCINGSYYDRVIPNYFDPDDILYSDQKDDYLLFIGRMIKRKGIITAYLAAKAVGVPLVIAGQGAHVAPNGYLIPNEDPDFQLPPGNWTYVGFVDVEQRKQLMAHARATFTPTEYLECFAGTHVESMLSGTPVITTNFGVFPGTFADGVGGYHCNTLDDFIWAARYAPLLPAAEVRRSALGYLMYNVRWQYQRWFEDLYQVYLSSVDSTVPGWHNVRNDEPQWRCAGVVNE